MSGRTGAVCLGVSFALLLCGNVYAEPGSMAFGVRVGTLGAGGEVVAQINPRVNARVGVNIFKLSYDATESDVRYKFDLTLLSGSALVDLHPTGGAFRLSGGLVLNGNKVDLDAEPATSYTIGSRTYTPAEVGTLAGKLDFNKAAPYAGFGLGNAVGEDKRWGFLLDLGLVFQGSPKVDLNAAGGLLASDADFLADLQQEEQDLEDDISVFKYYPVFSIGVTYKFR